MVEYRFFRINPGGLIDSGIRVRLPDDAAAIAHAKSFGDSRIVEVWAGQRRVIKLPPQGFTQSV